MFRWKKSWKTNTRTFERGRQFSAAAWKTTFLQYPFLRIPTMVEILTAGHAGNSTGRKHCEVVQILLSLHLPLWSYQPFHCAAAINKKKCFSFCTHATCLQYLTGDVYELLIHISRNWRSQASAGVPNLGYMYSVLTCSTVPSVATFVAQHVIVILLKQKPRYSTVMQLRNQRHETS